MPNRIKNNSRKSNRLRKIAIVLLVILLLVGIIFGVTLWILKPFDLRGVSFNLKSGFYEEDINVEIEPDKGSLAGPVEIKYNMNGDHLKNTSETYSNSIKLNVPDKGYKLYTITASACKNDECTNPQVSTYVLGRNLNDDVTVDIININSAWENLYDYDKGIMVGGRTYDLNATLGGDGYVQGNYNNRGKEWMREAHITMFNTNGQVLFDQNAYIGISGGSSPAFDVKSLKIQLMGSDSELGGYKKKEFRLRSGGQDQFFSNIRSSVASRLTEEIGFDGSTSTRRIAGFLNGEYYGIFDMQENYSNYNLAQMFNLENEKRIKKHKGTEYSVLMEFGLLDDIWNDLDLKEKRDNLESIIDMDNYLEYYAVQILMNNTDWPDNNFEAWKYDNKNKKNVDNKYEDGRIRFLIYDTDFIYHDKNDVEFFDGSVGDIYIFIMDGIYNGRRTSFRKVMQSDQYRSDFIEILRPLLNGAFSSENVVKIIDEEANKIEHQVRLFYSDIDYDNWIKSVERLKKSAMEREKEIRDTTRKYFNVDL